MKKILTLTLALMAGVTLTMAAPGKKDKKAKQASTTQQAGKLTKLTVEDSLSYTAGITATQGLVTYLQQQYGIDEAHLADFAAGLREALGKETDPAAVARLAGFQIASMVRERILPGIGQPFQGTPDSLKTHIFYEGFLAGVTGDTTLVKPDAAQAYFEAKRQQIQDKANEAHKKENELWMAQNAKKDGVITTPSGLQYKILTKGTGEIPTASSEVIVKYEGKLIDGTVFDSSYKRGDGTATFRANQVIKGWTEALTMMPVGSKWELYIPQELGYGERQAGQQIKPYSALIFTVELVNIKKDEQPKVTTEPVKEPAKATKTTKGTKNKKK